MVLSLKSQSGRFARGREALHDRRQAWGAFEELARSCFHRASRQGKLYGFPDTLYVSSSDEITSATSQPWIRLEFGSRAVGVGFDGHHLISEGKCALLFSQGPRGEVVAFVFPFKSETHVVNDEHLVIGHLRDSRRGTKKWIEARLADLWSYAQRTSVEGQPSLYDRFRLGRMRLYHKCFGRSVSSIVGAPLVKGLRIAGLLKKLA